MVIATDYPFMDVVWSMFIFFAFVIWIWILIAIFSDLLSRAFDSWFIPLLGFFLLPWTTLAYACMWSLGTHEVSGFEWFIVILAFLADLSSYGGSSRIRSQQT